MNGRTRSGAKAGSHRGTSPIPNRPLRGARARHRIGSTWSRRTLKLSAKQGIARNESTLQMRTGINGRHLIVTAIAAYAAVGRSSFISSWLQEAQYNLSRDGQERPSNRLIPASFIGWPQWGQRGVGGSSVSSNLARLRLRPTRRVYCLPHSGGLGSLSNAHQRRSYASSACRACSRLPTRDIATPRQQPSYQGNAEHSSSA